MWSCSEIPFCAICSVFGRSISIVTCFYNYLIASHPYVVLFCYVLLHTFLSAYIFKLGGILIKIEETKKDHTRGIVLPGNYLVGESNREVPRVNTQTIKTPRSISKE